MCSISQSMLVHRAPSDHLGSSIHGLPLRDLARSNRLHFDRKSLSIVARLRRVRRREYPWPRDPDPNVKGGVLFHLSQFKPLQDKDKPKPVTLDFEKPLVDLQKKIIDVRKMANETGLDFADQIAALESKYKQALTELYLNLTPIQRVYIARHPHRPTFLDHVFNITEKFVELHGDRAGYDDPAIVTGLGTINGRSYMFIGHQKGRNTKENVARNFGMPTPHGYRKALRMMRYADHHGFPIVTFIDTPGAYADLKSEELGQGEAIAQNLRTMFGLKVPIVSIVIGEGGSGGALAIACANKLLMLENAVFYVASPEACAAILWKNAKDAPMAAQKLKITATELCKLQIADAVIPEPLGGAHTDPSWTSQQIRKAIVESMDELVQMDTEELLRHRTAKFRKIGGFQEGRPVDPIMKVNMKRKEKPLPRRPSNLEFANKVEKRKQKISKAKQKISKAKQLSSDESAMLKQQVTRRLNEVMQRDDIKNKIETLKADVSNSGASSVDDLDDGLKQRIIEVKHEIKKEFASALRSMEDLKLEVVEKPNIVARLPTNLVNKFAELGKEIQDRIEDTVNSSDLKYKINMLKVEAAKAGKKPDPRTQNKIQDLIKEIKENLAQALSTSELLEKHQQLETEIYKAIEVDGTSNSTPNDEPQVEACKAIEVDGTSNSTPNDEPRVEAQAGRTYA